MLSLFHLTWTLSRCSRILGRPERFAHLVVQLCLLCLLLSGWMPLASAINTPSTGTDLSTLEKRLFVEEYPSQTTDQRLARLEKFVFGSTRTGSDSERLTSLLLAVPDLSQTADADDASAPAPAASASPATNSAPAASIPESNTAQQDPAAINPSPNQGDLASIDYYPTVTALEEKILGHNDRTASLSNRLSALETKAFGKPGDSGKDFATRVDRLKRYVANKYGSDDYLSSPEPAVSARSNVPIDSLNVSSQITMLEKSVFAKTYVRDGIISRLDRLEKAVYPQQPVESFSSVPDRIRRLMNTLNPQELAQSAPYSGNGGGKFSDPRNSASKHHFWKKVGSVLGRAGLVAASTLGSSMGGMGGMGYPGYGSGMMMGPGFGGMY